MNDEIRVLEEPGAHHIDLAAAAFLSRRSVQADDARRLRLLEPVLDRDRRADRSRAEEIVAAGVAGALAPSDPVRDAS
jgi:hypothetical protein